MSSKQKYETVSAYINGQPERARELLNTLRKAILDAAPNASELFNYGVPAFALIEGGKAEEQILIASFKNHVAIYPHLSVIEKFSEELKTFKQGKGSIQFPLDQSIPYDLIVEMVKYRLRLLADKA